MALEACKECGKQISKKAAVCPHCGYKPRRTSLVAKLFLVLIGIGVIGAMFGGGGSDYDSGGTSSATAAKPSKTPEQIAEEKKLEGLRLMAVLGADTLKKSMRNPESFKVSSALAMEKTGAVCYEYRAQNGFGGMNVETAVLTAEGEIKTKSMDGFAKLWNKNCAGQTGYEYAKYIR